MLLRMELEAVGRAPVAARPPQPIGATAELAEARSKLREAAPPDRWESVMHEVHRLQTQERLSPLQALRTVYARLAAGWIPPARS